MEVQFKYLKLTQYMFPSARQKSHQEKRLFFEFVKGIETFEHQNGLDHYYFCPRSEGHSGIVATGFQDDGTTTLHLGPVLKAAIKFYV